MLTINPPVSPPQSREFRLVKYFSQFGPAFSNIRSYLKKQKTDEYNNHYYIYVQ